MDTVTFAQKIKEKYPQYQNTDDITLVNKIIEKYPQYKTQIIDLPKVEAQSTETGADIRQIGTDIAATTNTALDKFDAAKQRMDTGQQGGLRTRLQQLGIGAGYASGVAGDIIKGGVKAVLPQSAEDVVKTGMQKALTPIVQSEPVQNIVSKYEQLKQTNPALAQDIDSLLGVGMLALDVAGAGAGAKGAAAGVETGISATKTGLKAGKQIAGDIATAGGNALDMVTPKSENIMNRVARLKPTDAVKFQDMAGMTHGEYLSKTGNFARPDEIVKSEAKKFVASLNEVDNAMEKLPGKYQPAELKDVLEMLVEKETRVKSPDLKKVVELQNSYINGGLDMKQINEAKRLFERKVKLGYNKLMNPDMVELATNVDKRLRDWQFKQAEQLGLQNLGELNKQTQISKFIVDKLGQQLTGKTGLNGLELTDAVLLSGANPAAVAGFITRKVFADPGVQAKIAKMLSSGETQGFKKAIIGETKLPRLNPGKEGQIPTVSSGSTIPVAPKGSKMEFTGQKGGITPKSYDLNANTATTTKNTIKKGISKELPKTVKKSSSLSTLEQEAKKYKSAEEFIKAQGTPVYHGGSGVDALSKDFKISTPEEKLKFASSGGGFEGLSLTTDKSIAKQYSQNIGGTDKVLEVFINPKAKIKKIDLKGGTPDDLDLESLKKQGYDAVLDISSDAEKEFRALTKNAVITKKELTSIWEKSNPKLNTYKKKIDELDGQISELSYYDSPEDDALFYDLIEERTELESQLTDIWKKANKK